MLTMLIADDEKIIRESLCECMDWEALGVRVAALCSNGLEALEAILDEAPDIILTDIKMPGLDGLELIEKIQGIDRDMEIIILSGYREFDFAKKAMEYGVRRYLLKPVEEEQLIAAVEDAKAACYQRRSARRAEEEREDLRAQIGEHRRKQFLYDLFLPGRPREDTIRAYLLQEPNRESPHLIAFFTCLEEFDAEEYAAGLYALLEEGIGPAVDILAVRQTVALLLPDPGYPVTGLLGRYVEGAGREVMLQVRRLASLPEAVEALCASLLRYPKITAVDRAGNAYEIHNAGISTDKLQHLVESLQALPPGSGREGVEALVVPFFEPVEELYALQALAAHLLSRLLLHRQAQGARDMDAAGLFDGIYREQEPGAVKELLRERVVSLLQEEEKADYDLVNQVKEYVEGNLSDSNLSLKKIASQVVHVNVDYLSRVFAKRTGEKFSHYLNRLRVDKAKQLLSQDSSKVYLVAEQVGCGHNPRYFGQVFKKYAGITPTAYLESCGPA